MIVNRILLFIAFSLQTVVAVSATKTRPKLVVGIVVDQMRAEYLSKYYDNFKDGGFKRLLNEGYNCRNTHYNYVPTYTGPGHASIYTGTTPRYHGIIANNWYDRKQHKYRYCAGDDQVQSTGNTSTAGKMSPVNLRVSTITDEFRLSVGKEAKIIGISIKDRGAILPAGHSANAAYWYDGSDGRFISSSYYCKDLPLWVKDFNASGKTDSYLNTDWTTLLPMQFYFKSDADSNQFEEPFKGENAPVFPHKISQLKGLNGGYGLLRSCPWGNSLLRDFAIEAIRNEKMGMDSICDFLAISFSSTDYVGHQFGINAIETQDTYLRLDRDLAALFSYLDKTVGKNQYLVFLTADHGAVPTPSSLVQERIPGGYVSESLISDTLKKFLLKRFGDTLLESFSNEQVFLNHQTMERKGLKLKEVLQETSHFLYTIPFIEYAYTSFDFNQAEFNHDKIYSELFRGYHPALSGDILISYPSGYAATAPKGTTHGTAWNYDTHVPLLWFGKGIKPGSHTQYNSITQIAATLSFLLDINLPSAAYPEPITQISN